MTVRTDLADGTFDVFETNEFRVSKTKDFHPAICRVTVFSGSKKILRKSRPFALLYRLITFRSSKVQKELEKIREKNEQKTGKTNDGNMPPDSAEN